MAVRRMPSDPITVTASPVSNGRPGQPGEEDPTGPASPEPDASAPAVTEPPGPTVAPDAGMFATRVGTAVGGRVVAGWVVAGWGVVPGAGCVAVGLGGGVGCGVGVALGGAVGVGEGLPGFVGGWTAIATVGGSTVLIQPTAGTAAANERLSSAIRVPRAARAARFAMNVHFLWGGRGVTERTTCSP